MFRPKFFQICFWTFVNPFRINQIIEVTQRTSLIRLAWSALAFSAGLILTLVFLDMPLSSKLALVPAIGIVLMLLTSINLKDSSTDSLGIMILVILLMVTCFPADGTYSGTFTVPETIASLICIGVVFLFAWLLARAGLNRAFLFWPMGVMGYILAVALADRSWLFHNLSNFAGSSLLRIYPALLLLVLIVFRIQNSIVIIRSFKHNFDTENCYSLPLADFKRKLALMYLLLAISCYVIPIFQPQIMQIRSLTIAWIIATVLELDILQWLILSSWLLTRRSLLPYISTEERSPGKGNLIFLMPNVPLEPFGLKKHIRALSTARGYGLMESLTVGLLLHTSYTNAAKKTLEKLAMDNPLQYYSIALRVNEGLPAEARQASQTTAPTNSSQTSLAGQVSSTNSSQKSVTANDSSAPFTIPALFLHQIENDLFDSQVFSHHYQAPRGKEGAPLAAFPLWFPVAASAEENMTLSQIIYRSLASVREPFRRTLIILPNLEDVRHIYTELLAWALDWAQSSFGASLIPIPISLKLLAEEPDKLKSMVERIKEESKVVALEQGEDRAQLYHRYCAQLIELGASVPAPQAEDLTTAIEAGNAWLIIEDDCSPGADLKAVKQMFELVFNEAALSHVAIFIVTANKSSQLLTDLQTFHHFHPQETTPDEKSQGNAVSTLAAAICRITAFWGSLPLKTAMILTAILAALILYIVVVDYQLITQPISEFLANNPNQSNPKLIPAAQPFSILVLSLGLGLPFLGLIVGYVWGLAGGSEEVRRSSVEMLGTAFFADFVFLLALLPQGMTPGFVKSLLVGIAALPGAFLFSMALLMTTSLFANVTWHILSVRITRKLSPDRLSKTSIQYSVILHIARHGSEIPLPNNLANKPTLPLLISFKSIALIPLSLTTHPLIVASLPRHIFQGLKEEFAVASLLLEALKNDGSEISRRCLKTISQKCVDSWSNKDSFGKYQRPSTSFEMNALEYTARQLCYLTNMEELIVVR
jgi:hypothetical protein